MYTYSCGRARMPLAKSSRWPMGRTPTASRH